MEQQKDITHANIHVCQKTLRRDVKVERVKRKNRKQMGYANSGAKRLSNCKPYARSTLQIRLTAFHNKYAHTM